MTESGFLCPNCKSKVETHHIVQCKSCQSIVNFIEAELFEEPVVFYIEKCSHCNGTMDDERRVQPYFFPDAFI